MPDSTENPVRSHYYLDRTGDLRKGYFYDFDFAFGDFPSLPHGVSENEVILSPRQPTNTQLLQEIGTGYLVIEGLTEENHLFHNCPLDPNHVTQMCCTQSSYTIWGNGRTADFIEEEASSGLSFTVTQDFAKRVKSSGLTGAYFCTQKYTSPKNSRRLVGDPQIGVK